MGGVSQSRMRQHPDGHAVFEGVVSLDNNGGFASVRSGPLGHGMKDATVCVLEVLGDGKRYKLNLRTDDAFDGVSYQQAFAPACGVWSSVSLPLTQFLPSFRGRSVADAPPLHPARICRVGLMVADRQAGTFSLAIRSIRLC